MGAGSAWGSREEFLHPRDSHGRFRSSWKMAEGVVDKITALLDRFNPKTFNSDQDAQTYIHSRARANRFLTNNHAAIDRFLRGFSSVNAKLEKGDTSGPDIAAIDRAMDPLPDDLILSRTMPPEAFGLNAQNIGQIEELTGKLISSKGYTSASIGTPEPRQPGRITMTIATPAGTRGVIPNTSQPSKEIILSRDQPLRVTKVESDGNGGWNVLAIATGDSEGETPVDIARTVPGSDVPEAAPQAPQANAPGAPAPAPGSPAAGAPAAAPVRTGRPGRPAGPPPAARNEGHVTDSVGTGQAPGSPPSAPVTPEPAPSAPEAPGNPPAPELPVTPEPGTDPRATFRQAFEDAQLKVPSVGTRRKQFEDSYRNVASGKKTPQEAVAELDNHIALNKRILASDMEDGTDSGPLPEDIKRQEALSDLIKEHFNFTGRKKFKESGGETKATPAKKAAPSPVAPEASAPEKKPEPERLIPGMAPGKTNAGRVQVGEKILVTQNKQGEWVPATRKTGATTITVTGKSNTQGRAGLRRQAPQRTIIKGTDENGNEISVKSAPSHQTFWTVKEKPSKEKATPTPKKSTAEADAEITRTERERKAQIRREMRAEREARGEAPAKKAAPKQAEPSATEKARTETLVKSLERAKEPKKAIPAPQRPQIPAKDLSDKGLLQRFETEIKKDNPDEARLKELGDELDRRDLETKNRVKGLSDADLEAKFQEEIRKDNPDPEEMQRLGDELDRRDAEVAATQKKIDDLVAKGRDYRDAWAEVHGVDPEKLDLQERQNLLDASRRAGESREDTLRRLYAEHVHRQYLDAESVTRGHLLTPEGRSKGIDPRSLFSGSNVNANKYASDELKEYWEKNPRKTYIEYKADTLGRSQDKAAAEKVHGVARNLELGERLTRRSPQKKAVPGAPRGEAPQPGTPRAPEIPRTPRAPEAPQTPKTPEAPKVVESDLDKMTIAQLKAEAERRGIQVPKALRLKADIKEFVREGGHKPHLQKSDTEGALAKQAGNLPGADIDKMTIPQLKEEAARRGVKVPSKLRKAEIQDLLRNNEGQTGLPNAPEAGAPDIDKMTVAQLKAHAEENDLQVPRALRLKQDIKDWVKESLARKKEGIAPEQVLGQRELKRKENAARGRLKELRRQDRITPEELAAEKRGVNRGASPVLYGDDLKSRLDKMTSGEQGDDLMVSMDPSRAELVNMAKSLNIAHPARANKQEIKDAILYWGLGRRLQSEAIGRPAEPTGVLANAMERRGAKRSLKPKLDNNWGVPGGEVNYHEDGHIGRLVRGLGPDANIQVNGDRLDNTLGKEATRLVRGDITQQDMIDKLRSMSVQMDASGAPDVANKLRRAADAMDSPKIERPSLPVGTPDAVEKLMDRLVASPLARSEGPGGRDNEVEALSKLMRDWEDGRISPLRLSQGIRDATLNRRHESNEGKFEIDRAANDAIREVERLFREDRDKLRPPSARQAHAEQPLPQRVPREALRHDLSEASMPELRAVAQSEGVSVPSTLRSKKEVASYLDQVRAEKAKADTLPEMSGHQETLARLMNLQGEVSTDPDARIAVGFAGTPKEIIDNTVTALRDGKFDNPAASRMLGEIQQMLPADSPLRSAIQDARNDLDDIYLNSRGGGGNIGPEKYHVGVTRGIEDLVREVTPEALADPKTKRDRISTGQVGANAKVTLPNGKTVFEKTSKKVGFRSGESSSDSEQLMPAIGTSIGAPTMPTMRMSPDTIYTDWVDGFTPGTSIIPDISDIPTAGHEDLWSRLKDSREGKILGLLDMITFNGDRHGSNWGVDGEGNLVGIDNGMGWGFTDFDQIDPNFDPMKVDLKNNVLFNLADRFTVSTFFDDMGDDLKDNDFTIADMEKVRARLEALREQFRHLNREQWLDLSLKVIDILKPHAKGTKDLIE